ncbi:MAG: serine protease [Nitrospira sp.]
MSDYLDSLRDRADRAFQKKPLADFQIRVRAIIGPAATQLGPAQDALNALHNGEEATPTQLAALELVIRTMRPAPLSKNGELPELENEVASCFVDWESFRVSVKPFLYAIGRVDLMAGKGVGSGFLISKSLFVTNKHVLDMLSSGTNKLARGQAAVRFREEYNSRTEKPVDILEVVAVHPTLDMSLFRIEDQVMEDNRIPLNIETAGMKAGQSVVAVGYPFEDVVRNPVFISALFGDRFGVKRAAPGEIVGTANESIFHDCSTLGGNSGSPILSMDKVRVVGVHRDGFFMYRNEAVDGKSLSDFVTPHLKA